jgi:hypothetical protein
VYASGEANRDGAGPAATGLPQRLQNREPAGRSEPHEPQARPSRVPHSRQKSDCGGFSRRHLGQCIPEPPAARRQTYGREDTIWLYSLVCAKKWRST